MPPGTRLRVGVLLWVASWIPYGVLFGLRHPWLEITWMVEVLLGLAGLALAGTAFASAVKEGGWRRAPGIAWRAMLGRVA